MSVDSSQDGKWLASGGQDGTICLWENPALGRPAETPMSNRPEFLEFSPCGRWLAVVERVADGKEIGVRARCQHRRLLWSELSIPTGELPLILPVKKSRLWKLTDRFAAESQTTAK